MNPLEQLDPKWYRYMSDDQEYVEDPALAPINEALRKVDSAYRIVIEEGKPVAVFVSKSIERRLNLTKDDEAKRAERLVPYAKHKSTCWLSFDAPNKWRPVGDTFTINADTDLVPICTCGLAALL